VIRNAILELAAENTAFSPLAKVDVIASFITPQFLVDLHAIMHNGKNARWIRAEHGFVAETDMGTGPDRALRLEPAQTNESGSNEE
jgi:hypothetical protein